MKKLSTLLIILTGIIYLSSCNHTGENSNAHDFKIDSNIIFAAKEKLRYYRPNNPKSSVSTKVSLEFYINNKLDPSDFDTSYEHVWGKYYWINDTLIVTGSIGELSTTGFVAEIHKGSLTGFYHLQCTHDTHAYKVELSDSLKICAYVPCSASELIISHIPDSTKKEMLFGYVAFKSKNYYYYYEGKPIDTLRANMKFYFRAKYDEF